MLYSYAKFYVYKNIQNLSLGWPCSEHAVDLDLGLAIPCGQGKSFKRYPNIETKLHFRCERGSRELRPKHWIHVAWML